MFEDNGHYLLGLIEFFLFFAWFMCLFWVLSDIFRSKDLSGAAKTIWVVAVIIVPWLGILVYLIVRGGGMHERAVEQAQAMQKAQTEYIQQVAGTTGTPTEQITSAKSLLDSGAINQAEFDQLKTKALAS
ncbi:MAG: SHOCT domain-containing protein [Actinomycetota bacterium]|nr:SHOCT domain-containing protein [Actinomycetota bacterium]